MEREASSSRFLIQEHSTTRGITMEIATSTLTCMWNTSESAYRGEEEDTCILSGGGNLVGKKWSNRDGSHTPVDCHAIYIIIIIPALYCIR